MPHAFRVFRTLRDLGFTEREAIAAASVIETARTTGCKFDREEVLDDLCDNGLKEPAAEALSEVLRNCFPSERYGTHFDRVRLKKELVRAGLSALGADALLDSVSDCVATPIHAEIRVAIKFHPGPGRVVMCDFTYLQKPEMQKERRAIIICPRPNAPTGRCKVIPVSMTPPRGSDALYHEFAPGAYPFFHPNNPVWAVCDHVYTVSFARLWRVNVHRRPVLSSISDSDLAEVRRLAGEGIGSGP